MAVCALCLFLTVPWVGQRSVIVTFPNHAYLVYHFNVNIAEVWTKPFGTRIVFPKEYFEKKSKFEKEISRRQQKMKNYAACKK